MYVKNIVLKSRSTIFPSDLLKMPHNDIVLEVSTSTVSFSLYVHIICFLSFNHENFIWQLQQLELFLGNQTNNLREYVVIKFQMKQFEKRIPWFQLSVFPFSPNRYLILFTIPFKLLIISILNFSMYCVVICFILTHMFKLPNFNLKER